jgi:Mg/Co/Ni transporter MgtE
MEALDAETAAETLGELEPEMQADVLEDLSPELAAEILAELPPDEAADVLAEMSAERADDLLRGLEPEEAEDIRELMAYDEDVAGGMMTNDFVALNANQTAEETIQALRKLAPPAEEVYYLYVVDHEERLRGVLSLRDLIVAPPDARLEDIIHQEQEEIVHVPVDMEREEVVRLIDKYNLLAVPVVDKDERLVGVITVDDALAAALPEEPRWLPRLHR